MGLRSHLFELVDALFDFARVRGSAQTTTAKTVTLDLEGSVNGDSSERRAGQGFWGHAAILARPKAPTTTPQGECEVFYVRRGEEMVSIASRDLRWQVDLNEGDVVVRSLDGTNPVRLRLLANGDCRIEANKVVIDATSTTSVSGDTDAAALASVADQQLNDLKTAINAWTPVPNDGGAALKVALTAWIADVCASSSAVLKVGS